MTSGGATINPAPPSSPPVEPSPPSQPIPAWIIAGLILMYEAAELDLLRTLADIVNRHVDPRDVHQRISLTATLQARVNFIVQQLQRQVSEQLPSTMADAVNWGDRIGYNEVRQVLGDRRARITTPDPGLADRAARDAIDQLRLMHLTVRQVVNNAAQQMHEHAAIESAVSDLHLHDAKQRLLERYARSGVTGFIDRRGRRWDLSTYAEMKIRTSATNAAVDAHLARISSSGIGLVHVSDSPRECELCRPWENKILSISGSVGTYTVPSVLTGEPVRVEVAGSIARARLAGLFHPNCFPGTTRVTSPSSVVASDARWYEGEIVVINTASGDELSVTPNHPILTSEGWIAAGSLKEGDDVIRHSTWDEMMSGRVRPDDEQVPSSIGEIHDALRQSISMLTTTVPAASEQFHGDGKGSDVEVVLTDGLLKRRLDIELIQMMSDHSLIVGSMRLCSLLPERASTEIFMTPFCTTQRDVRGSGQGLTLLDRHQSHPETSSIATRSNDATFFESSVESGVADAERGRDLINGLTGQVSTCRIIKIERRQFSGHVYNLQTDDGWYVAESILVHNCTHFITPYMPGATKLSKAVHDPQGYADAQKLRALERRVRQAKRVEAVALTPAMKTKAHDEVRHWQTEVRAHARATDQLRRIVRERPEPPARARRELSKGSS